MDINKIIEVQQAKIDKYRDLVDDARLMIRIYGMLLNSPLVEDEFNRTVSYNDLPNISCFFDRQMERNIEDIKRECEELDQSIKENINVQ